MSKEIKFLCKKCGNAANRLQTRVVNLNIYCSTCAASIPEYSYLELTANSDTCEITASEPANFGKDELIDYFHKLNHKNNKIASRTFSLIPQYLKKGYTYYGMKRALEYFYVIKGNDIAKAQNSIGIIPYVYEEAEAWYHKTEMESALRMKANCKVLRDAKKPTVVKGRPMKRKKRELWKPIDLDFILEDIDLTDNTEDKE